MSSGGAASSSLMGSRGMCEWAMRLFAIRCECVLLFGNVIGGWLIGWRMVGQRLAVSGFHRTGKSDCCPGVIGNSNRFLDVTVCEKDG